MICKFQIENFLAIGKGTGSAIPEWSAFAANFKLGLDFLNKNEGAIQGISTVVLIGVTIYSVMQAKRTVDEMEEARRYEFLPILELEVTPLGSDRIRITVTNIGKGLAREVWMHLPIGIDKVRLKNAGSRGTQEIIIHLDSSRLLGMGEEKRRIRVEYMDVFSRRIVSEALFIAKTACGDLQTGQAEIDTWNLILPK
ncbi:MAG TPA: hypothetical protein VGE62_03355 [Candidatus Paceibacterota bacterium]